MSVLIIELGDLKTGSCRAAGVVEPGELYIDSDSPLKFTGPLNLDARVSTTDHLSYYVTGRLRYTAQSECRRCLKPVDKEVDSELRGMYAFTEALDKLDMSEEERQEEGIFPLEAGSRELDLTLIVREVIVLEYPRYTECDKGCRGICPSCGRDLNLTSCDCRDDTIDPRWSKLLELKNKK